MINVQWTKFEQKSIVTFIYAKTGVLRRLKRLVPANTMLLLYRSFVLSYHVSTATLYLSVYVNYYGIRTITNMGKRTSYKSILRMVD